jgi:hypothetical protein
MALCGSETGFSPNASVPSLLPSFHQCSVLIVTLMLRLSKEQSSKASKTFKNSNPVPRCAVQKTLLLSNPAVRRCGMLLGAGFY